MRMIMIAKHQDLREVPAELGQTSEPQWEVKLSVGSSSFGPAISTGQRVHEWKQFDPEYPAKTRHAD